MAGAGAGGGGSGCGSRGLNGGCGLVYVRECGSRDWSGVSGWLSLRAATLGGEKFFTKGIRIAAFN